MFCLWNFIVVTITKQICGGRSKLIHCNILVCLNFFFYKINKLQYYNLLYNIILYYVKL